MLSAAGLGVRPSHTDGDRTLLLALLGTWLLSGPAPLSFVTGGFVWLPPVGKETHRGSSNLPPVNIYVTRSPAWLKVAFPVCGDGFDGIRIREQPKVHPGASWPLVFLSCLRDTDIFEVVVDCFSHGNSEALFPEQAGSMALSL